MKKDVYIPKFGQTVEEVTIINFLVDEGAAVRAGDEILEVETDKAVFSIEADVDGFIHFGPYRLHDVVPILTVVAVIGKQEDAFSAEGQGSPAKPLAAEQPVQDHVEILPVIQEPGDRRSRLLVSPRARKLSEKNGIDFAFLSASGASGRIQERDVLRYIEQLPDATPLARRVAQENGSDLSKVTPTQPGSRITRKDVEAFLDVLDVQQGEDERQSTEQIIRDEPVTGMRRIIAEKMLAGSQQTAPVTLFMDVDASALVELRVSMKASAGDGRVVGYNEIIAKIVANTMEAYPFMNARITGEHIQWMQDVHIGIAVDTDRGLIVPVVRNVNRLNIYEISTEFFRMLGGIRSARISPEDLVGSTFTITNLGAHDVRAFTPIINLPESAILGLGMIEDRVIPAVNGICVRKMTTLSLTFDHRLFDGAPAARFLKAVKFALENIRLEDLE